MTSENQIVSAASRFHIISILMYSKSFIDEFLDWRKVLRGSNLQENQGPNVESNETTSGRNHQLSDQDVDTSNQRNSQETSELSIEIGDKNDDGSADEVASMTSERSRSSSRPRSPAGDQVDTYLVMCRT